MYRSDSHAQITNHNTSKPSLDRTVRCDVLRWAVNSVADCVDGVIRRRVDTAVICTVRYCTCLSAPCIARWCD